MSWIGIICVFCDRWSYFGTCLCRCVVVPGCAGVVGSHRVILANISTSLHVVLHGIVVVGPLDAMQLFLYRVSLHRYSVDLLFAGIAVLLLHVLWLHT